MDSGTSIVDEIMLEFGSHTCADVSLETVRIVYVPPEIEMTYQLTVDMWARFRRSDVMVAKYGPASGDAPALQEHICTWYEREIVPVLDIFIQHDQVPGPYYLCVCRESGDEYFIRRALPDDRFTKGKFMTMECRFSKMDDCVPRNKLSRARGDVEGEYILFIIHKPGTMEDQERLRETLEQHAREMNL
jgi:hypothetical protein